MTPPVPEPTQHEAAIEAAKKAMRVYRHERESTRRARSIELYGHPGAVVSGVFPEPDAELRAGLAAYDAARSGEAEGDVAVIEWWDDPNVDTIGAKGFNARYFRHVGCDEGDAPWIVPQDGAPPIKREDEECPRCCQVFPLVPRPPEPRQDQPVDRASGEREWQEWRCPDCGSGITKVHMGVNGPRGCGRPPGYWSEHPKTGEREPRAFTSRSPCLKCGSYERDFNTERCLGCEPLQDGGERPETWRVAFNEGDAAEAGQRVEDMLNGDPLRRHSPLPPKQFALDSKLMAKQILANVLAALKGEPRPS